MTTMIGWRWCGYSDDGLLKTPLMDAWPTRPNLINPGSYPSTNITARCSRAPGDLRPPCNPVPGYQCSCGIYFLPIPDAASAFFHIMNREVLDGTICPPQFVKHKPQDFDVAMTLVQSDGRVIPSQYRSGHPEAWTTGTQDGTTRNVQVMRADAVRILAVLTHPWHADRAEKIRRFYGVPVTADHMTLENLKTLERLGVTPP